MDNQNPNILIVEERIRAANLKVTPQRTSVLGILLESSHPTAEVVIEKVREKYSSISASTIYNILDIFVEKGIINKVYTHGGVMRYDAILDNHHHLHDIESDKIEDYFDDELDQLIQDYFIKNTVKGFELKEIKIKLRGKFTK